MKFKPSKTILSRYQDYDHIFIDYQGRLLYINSHGEEEVIKDWAFPYNQEEEKAIFYEGYDQWVNSLWNSQKQSEKRGRKSMAEINRRKPGAGRPRKYKSEREIEHLNFTCDKDVAQWLREEASKYDKSLSAIIGEYLKKAYDSKDTQQ